MTAPRILIVLTSHDTLGDTGHKTGFWLEEFAAPYYVFRDAGAEVTLASPAGGHPPIDPKSAQPEWQTAATHRFDAVRHFKVHVMRQTEVQLQDIALHLSAVANAVNFQFLAEDVV